MSVFCTSCRTSCSVDVAVSSGFGLYHARLCIMALSQLLLGVLDAVKEQAKEAILAVSSCLCQRSAQVKINGRTCEWHSLSRIHGTDAERPNCLVNVIKVLGEGGFSFVYLAQDDASGVRGSCSTSDLTVSLTVVAETVCAQKDQMSHRFRGRQGGHARGRSLSTVQVSTDHADQLVLPVDAVKTPEYHPHPRT